MLDLPPVATEAAHAALHRPRPQDGARAWGALLHVQLPAAREGRSERGEPAPCGLHVPPRPVRREKGSMSEPFRNLLSRLSAHGSMLTMQRGGKVAVAHCPAHEDNKQSLSLKLGDDGKVLVHCFAGCETEAVVERLGLKMNDLFADSPARQAQASEVKIVATYDYRDEKGELLNQVVRLEPKSFRQRRPDGKGGWIWALGDVRRVLYRLPEMNRDRKQPLWIVEGEKDADALAVLGFRVTTTLGG